MKSFLFAASVAVVTLTTSAFAADVGVSVSIGQPGFYGRIDLGSFPSRPPVIYGQPRIIERSVIVGDPVYLRVPPGHRKNWGKHCGQYNACGEQVYFVQDNWYEREYIPQYREQHGGRGDDRDDRDDRGGKHGKNGHGRHDKDNGRGHN